MLNSSYLNDPLNWPNNYLFDEQNLIITLIFISTETVIY